MFLRDRPSRNIPAIEVSRKPIPWSKSSHRGGGYHHKEFGAVEGEEGRSKGMEHLLADQHPHPTGYCRLLMEGI
jgi:hypothetical protein